MAVVPTRPSWRPWWFLAGAVWLAQIALLAWLGDRPRPKAPTPPELGKLYLAASDSAGQRIASRTAWSDPALFALPRTQGFSGKAWLEYAPLERPLSDWTEPPRWLAIEPDRLGQAFSGFVAAQQRPPQTIADRPYVRPFGEVAVPALPLPDRSTLRIEGALAQRKFAGNLKLPSWPHHELLSNTVVQVMADRSGACFSATLLAESGFREADQFALRTAMVARFEPWGAEENVPPAAARFTWGQFIFEWHTVAPPLDTNVPARLP